MSGYRGGIFKCPFYARDYKDYLNCEGAQLRLKRRSLDRYTQEYCAGEWRRCSIARRLLQSYEREDEQYGTGTNT